MKKFILWFLILLLLTAGAAWLLYPTGVEQWSAKENAELMGRYYSQVHGMPASEISGMLQAAGEYNAELETEPIGDVFTRKNSRANNRYQNLLKGPEGIIGQLQIPRIGVKLPVYHTSQANSPEKKLILDFVFPRWTVIEEKNAEDIAKDRIPDDPPSPAPASRHEGGSEKSRQTSPQTRRSRRAAALVLSIIAVFEASANGLLMMIALDADVSYSSRKSYRQMISTYEPAVALTEEDPTFFRSEKLVHRKKNDNFALGIRGMSNSTSTLNARAVELLAQFGYAAQSHWSMYAGATAVTDALFGIKYVMADETDDKPVMNYIHDLYDLIGSTDTHIDVYENPWSLSLAYAVSPEVMNLGQYALKDYDEELETYTDPFTYMNKLLSAMTGREVAVWHKAELMGTDNIGCDTIFATGHKGFRKTGSGGASVVFTVEIDSTDALYCYFPSKWPREASLMLNGSKIGKYFDGEDFSIRELGRFQPGEIINASLVLKKDEIYIRSGVSCFWYFDEEAFRDAISDLQSGVMTVYSERDDELYGTVTIPAGRELLFTTIPMDEGWQVTVDGRPWAEVSVLKDSLMALRIPAGEHEIRFRYRPACVRNGWILTAAGALLFTAGCLTEGLIPLYRMKRKRKEHD